MCSSRRIRAAREFAAEHGVGRRASLENMKKRPASHVIDSTGAQLLRSALPEEWVVREYQPDYGIDFAVEVFDSQGDGFVTLGEHFFVQLKSHSDVKWITKEIYARYNVEKTPLTYNRNESSRIRVIAEPLETAELQLAQSMGPAAPLALVVADITRSEVHWVCLNDFVEQGARPGSGTYCASFTHRSHTGLQSHRTNRCSTSSAEVPRTSCQALCGVQSISVPTP